MDVRKLWVLPVAALVLSGCAQTDGPLGPEKGIGAPDAVQASLSCQADVHSGTVSCTLPEAAATGGASGAIIGRQNEYVLLESSGVSYDTLDAVGPSFRADVALRNYLTQALGTVDGITADPNGIRIFFASDPQVTAGTGAVSVRNNDGTDNFTTSGQAYFQYDEVLAPGQVTAARNWQWDVPRTVEAFSFQVGVSASVPDEANLVAGGTHLDASTIAVGHLFTCALDKVGKAYCWGLNASGQLGIAAPDNRAIPTAVAGGHTFSKIVAGENHACALTADGDAYCWGAGSSYRLGNGETSDQFAPVAVQGGVKFSSISAGGTLTCGVSTDNDAYCWGGNGNAKTGRGLTTGSTTTPTIIQGGHKYKSVSAGYFQGCGITTDDVAVCWGNSNLGRLGVGDTTGNILSPTPFKVEEKFSFIETGSAYTCALTLDGDAYCAGVGGSGQTGFGVQDTSWTPRKVLGDHKFATIAARFAHTCATKANGEAWCWGSSGSGRLGTGSTANQSEPVQVQTNVDFTYVGVGHQHSCGITTEGAVYCWGSGNNGQTGIGQTSSPRHYPDRISPIPPTN